MWVKLTVPPGTGAPGGYHQVEVIANLNVSGEINGSYYIAGRIGTGAEFDNLTIVYLDPGYPALADAQSALDRLVDDQGLLSP